MWSPLPKADYAHCAWSAHVAKAIRALSTSLLEHKVQIEPTVSPERATWTAPCPTQQAQETAQVPSTPQHWPPPGYSVLRGLGRGFYVARSGPLIPMLTLVRAGVLVTDLPGLVTSSAAPPHQLESSWGTRLGSQPASPTTHHSTASLATQERELGPSEEQLQLQTTSATSIERKARVHRGLKAALGTPVRPVSLPQRITHRQVPLEGRTPPHRRAASQDSHPQHLGAEPTADLDSPRPHATGPSSSLGKPGWSWGGAQQGSLP